MSKSEKLHKLSVKAERFVEALVDPETTSQKQAAIIAGYAEKNAHKEASRLLTNVDIRAAYEKRKAELAKAANITKEAIIGAAAINAMATIDDALDEYGHFDIQKARKTGAIHSIRTIKRTPNKFGESVHVEFYSAADARKEVAEYLGIKQLPHDNEENLQRAVDSIVAYLELNPDYDLERAVRIFAKARAIDPEILKQQVLQELDTVG